MFCSITSEMAKRQISKEEMAYKLGMSAKAFEKKLKNAGSFKINEIFEVQKIFNSPECTFEYLLAGS